MIMNALNGVYSARTAKVDKHFIKKLDFKDIKVPVKVRYIHKMEKSILLTLLFLVMKIRKTSNLCIKRIL